MASRLSSDGLPKIGEMSGLLLENPGDHRDLIDLDLDKLVQQSSAKQIVRSLPPQPLYHAIRRRGISDSGEVLRLISTEQLTRFLDYDVWPKDKLSPEKVFEWLVACGAGDPLLFAERFSELEEEYQLSLLQGKIKVVNRDQLEEMSPEQQDELRPLPGEELFYSVHSGSRILDEAIVQLVESLIVYDLKYALAVLNHAYWAIPNEAENTLSQFRKARLEEDGFVSYEESLSIFARIPSKDQTTESIDENLLGKSANVLPQAVSEQSSELGNYFERVVSFGLNEQLIDSDSATELQNRFLFLGNCLASATKVEPNDVNSLGFLVKIASAYTGLGCEMKSHGDLELGVKILLKEVPKSLFSLGLQTIYSEQQAILDLLVDINAEAGSRMERSWRRYHWSRLQTEVESFFTGKISQGEVETLVAFFAQFPLSPGQVRRGDGRIYFTPVSSLQDLANCVKEIKGILRDFCLEKNEEDR